MKNRWLKLAAVAAAVVCAGCDCHCAEIPNAAAVIDTAVREAAGDVAVVMTDLDSGETLYSYNAGMQMPSASTIKVLIMAELLRRVENGELDLNQRVSVAQEDKLLDSIIGCLDQSDYSLRDLIVMMIIESDNTATNVLIDIAGFEPVNRMASELGLENTSLQRKMLDFKAAEEGRQNYSSAADMDKIMQMIGRGELISPDACRFMLHVLNMQKDIESFKRYMPEGLIVAHKSGTLDKLEHETGIFWVDGNDYVLTIFTQNQESNSAARDFIGQLSLDIFQFMNGDLNSTGENLKIDRNF